MQVKNSLPSKKLVNWSLLWDEMKPQHEMPDPKEGWLPSAEVAKIMGVAIHTLFYYVKRGKLEKRIARVTGRHGVRVNTAYFRPVQR